MVERDVGTGEKAWQGAGQRVCVGRLGDGLRIGRGYVFREVEIACGWLESTCLGMFVCPCYMEKLECREEKRWRQALRYERFDVTLFQDKLCLSITHEQVQEAAFGLHCKTRRGQAIRGEGCGL